MILWEINACNRWIFFKFLCDTWWGADPSTLLILYTSFIRSMIDYGSFIYLSYGKNSSDIIETIQYQAIRIALGYRRGTPVNILIAESNLSFIKFRAYQLGRNFVAKNFNRFNSRSLASFKLFEKLLRCREPPINRILHACILDASSISHLFSSSSNLNIYGYDCQTVIASIPFDIEIGSLCKTSDNPQLFFNNFFF